MVLAKGIHPSVFELTIIAIAVLAALLLTVGPVGADNTGPPVITSISEGGYASDWYDLWVRVSGDMLSGTCYYGIDTDDQGSMEEMEDAGGDYNVHIDLTGWEDGPHTIYVRVFNSTGVTVDGSVVIDVDNHSPHVEALSNYTVTWGDFTFEGIAEDPYLNESAVYCLVDDDEAASRDNLMTWATDHFEYDMDTTKLADGEHLLRVWAFDLWGNSNKSHAVNIKVSNAANLVIEEVRWKSTKVDAGEKAVVEVTVRNQGGTAASGFDVAIVAGDKVLASTKAKEDLGSGETVVIKVSWGLGGEGTKQVKVRLDTEEAVAESDEDDNTELETTKLTFEGGIPGPGAMMAVLAAIAGALPRLRRRDR